MTGLRNDSRPRRLRIVVGGFLGLLPAGGVTWDYLQYLLCFAELGCDVFYVEDTRLWPVFQEGPEGDCRRNVEHLSAVMQDFGLGERWAYRDEASGECFGLSLRQVRDVCRTADLFVNISCSTVMRDEYRQIPVRALIDSDPMFTQIQLATESMFTEGKPALRELVEAHTHHFTFGENIAADDCRVPTCDLEWIPTRQPISLEHWPVRELPRAGAYSTVMNWSAGRQLEYQGETWGQKDQELAKLWDLPSLVPGVQLATAVSQTGTSSFPRELASQHGWQVLDPRRCAGDWQTYRDFIYASRGEFSVAKETYVKARTGWFSCRSACYLAAGRPVVTQDTGWSRFLPAGEGLLAFETPEEAAYALREVNGDPQRHSLAARSIAEQYFDGQTVLQKLLDDAGVPISS